MERCKKAEEGAKVMKLTAKDLLAFGVIDKIIKEPLGGAHKDKHLGSKKY